MTEKLKCPFCNKELEMDSSYFQNVGAKEYLCGTNGCEFRGRVYTEETIKTIILWKKAYDFLNPKDKIKCQKYQ